MTEPDPSTTSVPFVPLSVREGRAPAPQVPVEGTPDYLRPPLINWFNDVKYIEDGLLERVKLRLRVTEISVGILFDAIDAMLGILLPRAQRDEDWSYRFGDPQTRVKIGQAATKLDRLLEDGGSVYRVAEFPGGLERRVRPAEAGAFDQAVTTARAGQQPAAADDLEAAWRAAYGLHPNPSEAYRLAVRAVEHVAIPVVEPASRRATLGTVRAALNVKPSKWHVRLGQEGDGEVELLVGQISLLWSGQVDRHGGQLDYATATQRQAEEAVHQAVLLVRYFSTGIVGLRNP